MSRSLNHREQLQIAADAVISARTVRSNRAKAIETGVVSEELGGRNDHLPF